MFSKLLSVYTLVLFITPLFSLGDTHSCGFPQTQESVLKNWSSKTFYDQYPEPGFERELAVVSEVLKGNIPSKMRDPKPVYFKTEYLGAPVTIQLDVLPDYLMIGTDDDFIRTPLTSYAAQFLASSLGFFLPTTFLVDMIYNNSNVQLLPQPMDWYKDADKMRFGSNYFLFNQLIEWQRKGLEGLISGNKKDVVVTNKLDKYPSRVAIYGWQEPGNHPIQPLAVTHGLRYEDYSHGVRFIGPEVKIYFANGVLTQPLKEALLNKDLGPLFNGGLESLNDVRAARTCDPDFAEAVGLKLSECPPQPKNCEIPQNIQ